VSGRPGTKFASSADECRRGGTEPRCSAHRSDPLAAWATFLRGHPAPAWGPHLDPARHETFSCHERYNRGSLSGAAKGAFQNRQDTRPAPHPLRRMVGQRPRDLFRSDAFLPEKQHRVLGLTSIQRLRSGGEKLPLFMSDKMAPCHEACSDQGPGNAPDSRTQIRPRPLHKPNACHAGPPRGPQSGT